MIRLGQVLIGRGLVTKHAVGETLGSQRSYPYVNLVTTPCHRHPRGHALRWNAHMVTVLRWEEDLRASPTCP